MTFEIQNGESQYYSKATVEAEDYEDAERKAEHYLWDYFGDVTKIDNSLDERKIFYGYKEMESIKIDDISEVTPEELATRLII